VDRHSVAVVAAERRSGARLDSIVSAGRGGLVVIGCPAIPWPKEWLRASLTW